LSERMLEELRSLHDLRDKAFKLSLKLDNYTWKLYIGYPPNEDRHSTVSTDAIRKLKELNERFKDLFKEELEAFAKKPKTRIHGGKYEALDPRLQELLKPPQGKQIKRSEVDG